MAKRPLLTQADYERSEMVALAKEIQLERGLKALHESVELMLAETRPTYRWAKLEKLEEQRQAHDSIWREFVDRISVAEIS